MRNAIAAMRRDLLAALPAHRRPGARVVLRMTEHWIPRRGLAKRSFLQCVDVARAATRQLGAHLVESRDLDEADDAFHLTFTELTGKLPDNARELVRLRKGRRAQYQAMTLPGNWVGLPEPIDDQTDPAESGESLVEGIGVSSGSVEGVARVVLDPSFAEVEPDEILVAPTTDPSWSSIMFISSALVVDIGGAMSHAAVVARELGLPCVVNTRTGTRRIRTGDRIRVDGGAGRVEILESGIDG